MLQTLSLVVDLVPFHAEDFGQHALDQVMTVQNLVGDLAAVGSELNQTTLGYLNEAVAFEAPRCHGDGWRR